MSMLFWVVTLCRHIVRHVSGDAGSMFLWYVCTLHTYKSTECHNSKEQLHGRDNLKFHKFNRLTQPSTHSPIKSVPSTGTPWRVIIQLSKKFTFFNLNIQHHNNMQVYPTTFTSYSSKFNFNIIILNMQVSQMVCSFNIYKTKMLQVFLNFTM